MKDKTFVIVLIAVMIIGIGTSSALMIHGYNLWKQISIVEMIANWG